MRVLKGLDADITLPTEVALTIGMFDGMHLGHQQLLQRLVQEPYPSVALTFSNHPLTILKPERDIKTLTTLQHRIRLIEGCAVDYLVILPFTKEFSLLSPEEFLERIRSKVPFKQLILGHDATIGKAKSGDEEHVRELAKKMHFEVHYISKYILEGQRVSSSLIRRLIKAGQLDEAEKFLGRPYSILSEVSSGQGHGKKIGFPTANIDISHLTLPPLGVYSVEARFDHIDVQGIANLGYAPTIKNLSEPSLEVHLFDHQEDLYGQSAEIIFRKYIRPEMQFNSIDELKQQIESDIHLAKKFQTSNLT